MKIIMLDEDDDIEKVTGENCYFHNSTVTGQISINTSKGKKYGPYGHLGNPDAPNRNLVISQFDLAPSSLELQPDRFHRAYLAPIDYDPHWRFGRRT